MTCRSFICWEAAEKQSSREKVLPDNRKTESRAAAAPVMQRCMPGSGCFFCKRGLFDSENHIVYNMDMLSQEVFFENRTIEICD